MRKPPLILLAVALSACGLAQAQATRSTASTTTTATTASGTSTVRVQPGGCVGTGGSTCTTASTAPGATAITTTTRSAETETIAATAPAASGASTQTTTSASAAATGSGSGLAGDVRVAPTENTTASGSSDLVASGQTSGSVASGQTTSTRRPLDNSNLGTDLASTLAPSTAPVISGSGDTIIGPNGERIAVNIAGSTQPAARPIATPTLDAAARDAAARERAKVARKQQLMHTVAPRTNNDRTDQMPDDPPNARGQPATAPPF